MMNERSNAPGDYEIVVDFMDMTNDGHVWVRAEDVRDDRVVIVDDYVIVGDDDAEPRVARVLALDDDGNIELLVLPGAVESHSHLLTPA